jgi:nitrite reductase/ring-hydroxylating ferredoxin subunit
VTLELPASDIEEGSLSEYELDGHLVLVTRIGGVVHAIGGRCRHLGCHLARGTLDGTVVTCPCHGSRFDVATGKLVEAVTKWPKAVRGAVSLAIGDEPVYAVAEEGETVRISR